ncbi:HU family DNA-binding protein [Vibrio sp. 10N.222.51.C8]|jgi:DNA-binding protein HU-beta|uniref:HU family DNA-binding protein n=1 Tax=unclassified Vibrio TaxID=2614977 RepID=UPI00080E268D|nr:MULTISPECIES: HU family DNA-binding protein [unclassified Vibrio]OCH53878.1 DNA-binding protein HU [Vibrio sp. ZF57]PMK20067.1 DNA-binding protein HU [Vibrio sp. 10N.261.54.C3]PML74426.1 DNA-binding protein HU [Vibrio sp. 10N.261.51.A7]PMO01289.1 DNA-binding protein HU [Vibrio sp. 10N.222.55.C12]PMO08407.1 DNA-binding protein HU [Vibrio sp. 10N.222.54.F10]
MNKSQLVEHIATSADISKDQAGTALNALVEGISTSLANGDDVSILGFGSFKVNSRAARTGRNPRTGEEIQIAPSKTPAFKAGKALKETCNL